MYLSNQITAVINRYVGLLFYNVIQIPVIILSCLALVRPYMNAFFCERSGDVILRRKGIAPGYRDFGATCDESPYKYACLFGIAGQPFWFYSAFVAEQWGIFALCFFYTYSWLLGVKNNWLTGIADKVFK